MYVCMCIYEYMHTYTHAYTHTHTHTMYIHKIYIHMRAYTQKQMSPEKKKITYLCVFV